MNSICPFDPWMQNNELCFIRIELEFTGGHPLFDILKASIEPIKGISRILMREIDLQLSVVSIKMELTPSCQTIKWLKGAV